MYRNFDISVENPRLMPTIISGQYRLIFYTISPGNAGIRHVYGTTTISHHTLPDAQL